MHNKASQTYGLRELCDGGNSEPNDTLKNINASVDRQHLDNENRIPHLFPKETAKLKRTAFAMA